MKHLPASLRVLAAAATLFITACSHPKAELDIQLPDKFEGKTVELVSFLDSVPLASTAVTGGRASFGGDSLPSGEPLFTQVVIDGRVRAYYILEPGRALLTDSMSVASGTPLNERFSTMLARLDSVDGLGDMPAYLDFSLRQYNDNRDNVLGPWFAVEWMKYSDLAPIDSMLAQAPRALADSRRAAYYLRSARLRAATAPGQRYTDFMGKDASGRPVKFSSLVRPGRYTLVDFWASWCPYCIKETPQLQQLYADWHDRGLDIVGVAVRDRPEDTAAAAAKLDIQWPVLYNTERRPYEIYGFSGIPHHILIGPDGVIVSRDENAAQTDTRLRSLLGAL